MDPATACPVCGDCDGKPLRHHYGATCCLKCRSFFLRAHKRTKSEPLECTSGVKCLGKAQEGKQLCQKCRLDRCLEIGMDPKHILSEDEKRERFKYYFKKKDEEQKKKLKQQSRNPGSSNPALLGPALPRLELVDCNSNASLQFTPGMGMANPGANWQLGNPGTTLVESASSTGSSATPMTQALIPANLTSGAIYLVPVPVLQLQPILIHPLLSPALQSSSPALGSVELNTNAKPMTDLINDGFDADLILESFNTSMGQLSPQAKSAQDLIKIHKNLLPMSLQTFMEQIKLFPPLLAQFASSQSPFQSLPREDQESLLKNNIPLYLQYIIGRYLTSKSGLEQLAWVLGENHMIHASGEAVNLTSVSFEEFVWEQFTFRSSQFFNIYLEYLKLIEHFFNFPQKFNGLIANFLLYNTTEKHSLKNPEKIESLCCSAQAIAEKELSLSAHNSFELPIVSFVLTQMNNIFKSMKANRIETSPATINFCASFTQAEENWLLHKFERMQIQFKSVRPSEMMIQEVMKMFTGQTSVAPANSSLWLAMRLERIKRTLRDQDVFQNLSGTDQKYLIQQNVRQTMIISLLSANLAGTADSQLRSFIGIINSDDNSSKVILSGFQGANTMKAIRAQKLQVNGKKMDQAQVAYISQLLRDVSGLFLNDQSFQILILLALFDTEELPRTEAFQTIFDIEKIFHRFFQQKLMLANPSFSDSSQVRTALHKLKVLTKLYESFLGGTIKRD